jgi:hypothetical protein
MEMRKHGRKACTGIIGLLALERRSRFCDCDWALRLAIDVVRCGEVAGVAVIWVEVSTKAVSQAEKRDLQWC